MTYTLIGKCAMQMSRECFQHCIQTIHRLSACDCKYVDMHVRDPAETEKEALK